MSRRHLRRGWWWPVVLLIVASCGPAGPPAASPSPSPLRGGTLRVVVPTTAAFPPDYTAPDKTTLDPLLSPLIDVNELRHCCLARTLLSYTGQPTDQGGTDLRPDLAAALPDVSADGLTWTFHLQANVHYAPPLQSSVVVAADFVRALQRVARVGQQQIFFTGIAGFNDYAKGTTQSISGLETPDDRTLVVRLTASEGDLGYRLALPYASPLPALPGQPDAPYGVATGHDDGDSAFVVSSGPYMIEGADRVDFTVPPAQQHGAAGFVSGRSVSLVRNPSWSAAVDSLRPAYADRIVVTYGGHVDDAVAAVDAGQQDIIMAISPPPQVPLSAVAAYRQPAEGGVDVERRDAVRYVSMNLAVPPFDDVHVRRAVAFAIDRAAIQQAFGGAIIGTTTGHLAPDSLEDNQLLSYDSYRASDDAATLGAARAEMAQSRYDSRHAGRCDAAACQHVAALSLGAPNLPVAMADTLRQDLAEIGLMVDVTRLPGGKFFAQLGDPTQHVAMGLFWAWLKDYPNGSDYFTQWSSEAIGEGNSYSLLGATPDQLRGWGYGVTEVPSVDGRIDACIRLFGDAQQRCWTQFDQYMMEEVVAAVPVISESYVEIVPKRVTAYSYDQSADLPALDRIAVAH